MLNKVSIDDFAKLDIRVGKVVEVTEVTGADKLLRCKVDFGPEVGKRTIFSGIKKWYKPEDLVGKLLPYVINLEPKKMFREESQGMLIASAPKNQDGEEEAVLLVVEKDVSPGTKVI